MLFHPLFMSQYEEMAIKMETSDLLAEVFGDVTGLITGLEELGHDIEGEEPSDASHPIVTSRFHTYALRRTPPNKFAQMAFKPPVIPIAYVWFLRHRSQRRSCSGDEDGRQNPPGQPVVPGCCPTATEQSDSRVGTPPSQP